MPLPFTEDEVWDEEATCDTCGELGAWVQYGVAWCYGCDREEKER